MVTQCAWCKRLTRRGIPHGEPITVPLPNASHGICKECRERKEREFMEGREKVGANTER